MAELSPIQPETNIFTDSSVRETINALIDKVVTLEAQIGSNVPLESASRTVIPAELTGRGSSEGYFQFKEKYWNPATAAWVDTASGLTHSDIGEAYCAGGLPGGGMGACFLGSVVMLRRLDMVNSDTTALYEFDAPPTIMPVDVTQTGGSQGTRSTPATWTYRVNAEDGSSLLTGVSPQNQRPTVGEVKKATQGEVHYEIVGGVPTLTLGWVNEVPDPFPSGEVPPTYDPPNPDPPYVPGGCSEDDILIFDGDKWVCHTPTTQTVLTGVSWNATTAEMEFTRETLTVIDTAGGVADTDITFYDCDGDPA